MILIGACGVNGAAAERASQPWTGEPGITEPVAAIMARERLHTAGVAATPAVLKPRLGAPRDRLPQNPATEPTSQAAAGAPSDITTLALPTIGVNVLAAQAADSIYVPPDTMGDVGPSQILVCINGRIRSFTRAGAQDGVLNTDTDTFFASVLNGSSASDPRLRYDRLTGRWFITMINVATPNRVLLAVSSGATVTSSGSFTFYQFQHDLAGTTPNADTGQFADYDTLGVDAHALYIGVNIFNAAGTAYLGSTGYVINKANLLAGTLTVTPFRQMATASGPGPYAPQGVGNDDPASTEGYFIGTDNAALGLLVVRRISNPGGSPSISDNLNVVVPTTSAPINPQPQGSRRPLDAVDDRLFEARIHAGRLWTAHNIQVDSTGTANTSGGRDGSRWYELAALTGTPTLIQSGTLFDAAAVNPVSYWMPSCAVSGQGHVVLGCSVGGATQHAAVVVAERLASDTAGSLGPPLIAQNSTTSYNLNDGQNPHRWGDYSLTTLDPNDNMTLWTFQEYCNSADSWGVRIVQLRAPPPATPVACAPPSLPRGATTTNVIVSGLSTNGSGFYDPGAGFSNRLAAALSGDGITIHSITYSGPTQCVLNVSVSNTATLGGRTVTATNPDGQTATSTSAVLTIAMPTWTITASAGAHGTVMPTNAVVATGSSTVFTVTAALYYAILEVRTNGTVLGGVAGLTNLDYVWSNVTANGTLNALFTPLLAPSNTPLWWLAGYGLSTDTNDDDGDGMKTWQEYVAGTDPTNSRSLLSINAFVVDTGTGTLLWASTTNGADQPFGIDRATDLKTADWTRIATGVPRTPPTNAWPFALTNGVGFFRVVATNGP